VVFIGFESLNEESLKGVHKVANYKIGIERYKDVIKRIHDHGIAILGGIILGLDGDRKDIFDRTLEFVEDSKLDAVQYSALTPLPGTATFEKFSREGRLLYTNFPYDWAHYDVAQVVIRPEHMSPEELQEGISNLSKQTHGFGTRFFKAMQTLSATKSPVAALFSYKFNKGYEGIYAGKYNMTRT
jgi:radical SAM superfamily enzyme YgiQ (UPF0313 family)